MMRSFNVLFSAVNVEKFSDNMAQLKVNNMCFTKNICEKEISNDLKRKYILMPVTKNPLIVYKKSQTFFLFFVYIFSLLIFIKGIQLHF